MQWYQVIAIILMILPIGYHTAKHGEFRKNEQFNVWGKIMTASIWAILLYAGGFWS